jgi:hypothetical protein
MNKLFLFYQFYKSVFLAKRLAYVFGFFVHIAVKAKYAVLATPAKPPKP